MQYSDFTVPQVSAENGQIVDNTLTLALKSDKALIKLDVCLDGKFAGSVEKSGRSIDVSYSDDGLGTASQIFVRVYDQYLNSADITIK